MKIVHVIDSSGIYGAERVLLQLVEEQLRDGLVSIVCSIGGVGEDKELDVELRNRGVKVDTLRFKSGINPAGISELSAYLHSLAPDIVHSHGYKPNVLLGLSKFIRRIPIWVVTMHGSTDTRHHAIHDTCPAV